MAGKQRRSLRGLWVDIHLWLGLTLGVLGIAIGITGSILVFHEELDELAHPQRYAVPAEPPALPYAEYLSRAQAALDGRAKPSVLRLPAAEGGPVVVLARAKGGLSRVFLDPASGRVLDVAAGGGFLMWAHQFHENLTLREYFGREVVGAVGIAMMISALSGIYLWWPLQRRWRGAFGFRPGFTTSRNLHYTCGFYGSLVLAFLSFTGIVIAYPEASRAVVGAFTPLSPSLRGVQAAAVTGPRIDVNEAVVIAHAAYPGASVAGIGLPAGPRGVYRIALRTAGDASERGNATVFVDPGTREIVRHADPATRTKGDAFLAWQRTAHEGTPFGMAGRAIFCVAGLLPGILAVTGTTMWLRARRRTRKTSWMLRSLLED